MLKKLVALSVGIVLVGCQQVEQKEEVTSVKVEKSYKFVDENRQHEGTWLTWPHEYTYGKSYAKSVESIWINIVKALSGDEKVHIVAYDNLLKEHIVKQLQSATINMANVDFVIAKSDDVWTRDTGPMFVIDEKGQLTIVDFSFDGWGKKTAYKNDDAIPKEVARLKNMPIVTIDDFVLEGGSVEINEDGTVLATKSAVISDNRNKGMSQETAEMYMKKYLGAKKFIWLEGVVGEDITDAHIDGMARFYDESTILTVSKDDFGQLYEKIQLSDYDILTNATNYSGKQYKIVTIPLTKHNVKGLDYKGSYLNYYLGNTVVLVPTYNDEHDQQAVAIFEKLYPNKKIVPINVVPLYKYGGMLHCITSHQPVSANQK